MSFRQIVTAFICLTVLAAMMWHPACASDNLGVAVDVTAQAIERSNQYTGFAAVVSEKDPTEVIARVISLDDSTTPFLGSLLDSGAVWRITFRGIIPPGYEGDKANLDLRRDFDVYVDSTSGRLVKIVCRHGSLNPENDRELAASLAEQQIAKAGDEYLSIPVVAPSVDFSEALRACPREPLSAREIVAQYVTLRHPLYESRPVWIISLRGITPVEPLGGAADWLPEYTRNRFRMVVDAVTGRVMYGSTTPAVPLTDEDRKRIFGDGAEEDR